MVTEENNEQCGKLVSFLLCCYLEIIKYLGRQLKMNKCGHQVKCNWCGYPKHNIVLWTDKCILVLLLDRKNYLGGKVKIDKFDHQLKFNWCGYPISF